MKRKYEKGKRFYRWGSYNNSGVLRYGGWNRCIQAETPLAEEMKQTKGNQITQELVDAFSNGQVNLLAEPSAELLGMDNPYDRTERDVVGCDFEWDHLLYDGAYFSYYWHSSGIIAFLAVSFSDGVLFSVYDCGIALAVIGMVGLSLAYMTFIRKWFGGLSTGMALAGLIIIQLVSGIWFCIGRPDIYEIAESAGFAFLTWGAWLLFDGNIIGPGKISLVKTALSSLIFSSFSFMQTDSCGILYLRCHIYDLCDSTVGKRYGSFRFEYKKEQIYRLHSVRRCSDASNCLDSDVV